MNLVGPFQLNYFILFYSTLIKHIRTQGMIRLSLVFPPLPWTVQVVTVEGGIRVGVYLCIRSVFGERVL